jgi:RNA polymerase sigma factor (sigma-70 family)
VDALRTLCTLVRRLRVADRAPMDEATRNLLNRNMAALADGERRAFDPVYRTLWPVLVRFVAVMSTDRMIAEDIAQQALLRILGRASTFDRTKDALAWSITIAVNEYRSYRRKHGKPGKPAADQREWALAEPIDDDTPEAIALRDNLRDAARAVIGQLRPQDLEVVVASLYDGQRPPLLAAAFRKRLQRAVVNARTLWKRRHGDDRSG